MYSSGMGSACCTLAIASHLSETVPDASLLVLTDLPVFGRFRLPPNLDYVHIPRLDRVTAGAGGATSSLRSQGTVAAVRRHLISATLESFDPQLVIVDRTPLGAGDELREVLGGVRRQRPGTRIISGLWDIPGDAAAIRDRWRREGTVDSLADLYDEIWVYGNRDLFDPALEYAVPEAVARKMIYTGYLRHGGSHVNVQEKLAAEGFDANRRLVLVTVGAGRDGFPLANAYLDFMRTANGSCDFQSHVVCGPMMGAGEKRALDERARDLDSVTVDRFHKDLSPYLSAASAVVATSSYNTFCQILSFRKDAVIVPRRTGTSEELMRARLLERHDLADVVRPEDLSPERLGTRLLERLSRPSPPGGRKYGAIPLDGLDNIAKRVADLAAFTS